MKKTNQQPTVNFKSLRHSLTKLHDSVQGSQQIISCYLDTGKGLTECQQYVEQQLTYDWYDQMHQFDQHASEIIGLIKQEIARNWHPQTTCMALFYSYQTNQPMLEVFNLDYKVDSQIGIHNEPDLRPILSLLNPIQNTTILAYMDKVIQIYDVELGKLRPVAWAMAPHLSAETATEQNRQPAAGTDKRIHQVCRSLLKLSKKPLMIAANSTVATQIKSWLPSRVGWKLRGDIEVPHHLSHSKFKNYMQDYFQRRARIESESITARLLNSLHFRGPAVTGAIPCLHALDNRQAQKLIINRQSATPVNQDFAPAIEASWLAVQQGIPVYQVHSDELAYRGGIGCMLKPQHQLDKAAMFIPDRFKQVELVA